MASPTVAPGRRRWSLRFWSRLWLWFQTSLSAKMTAIVIVGIVSLVALFAYLGSAALNESIQRLLEDRVVVAQATARHIDYALDNINFELTRAADHPELADPARRDAALKEAYDQLSFFGSQVFIVDRAGAVVAAYPPITTTLSLADSESLQAVLHGQAFAISRVAHPLGAAIQSPLAVAPLRDASSQVVGALGVSIDLNSPRLRLFTDSVGLGGSGYMDLVDSNGVILASTLPGRVGEPSDHDKTLVKMIQTHQPVVSQCHDCHAVSASTTPSPQVMAFAPLDRAPWGIMVRQDEEEVMATARDLQLRIFTLGAIALLGALLLVYLTTRSVIAPVQALTSAARRIAGGDLQTPIHEYGKDEIGVLARAFDTMRSQLQASVNEIQTWNRELDARVQERTAALTAAQREAQQSRDHLQTIIDSLSDELLVIDLEHRVTRVNATVQQHHPTSQALIGANCCSVAHGAVPCQPPQCDCPLAHVAQTGKPFRVTHQHVDTTDGSTRYLEVTASPLRDSEGRVSQIVELWRDVTEEKEMQEMILQRNRELSAVNAIARVVGQSIKIDECLDLALTEVRRITRMDVGSIFLLEGDERALRLRTYYGISAQGAEATGRLGLTDTACGGVLEIGEAVVVQQPSRAGAGSFGAFQREALASLIHVPLIAKNVALGTLCLGMRTPREFGSEEISLLSAIGSQIAVAVENARLYQELRRKEQLRGELLRRVISAQEDERKRIARELHDETSQILSALLYTLDAAAETCETAQTETLIDKMRGLTRNAIDGVHKLIFDLRPTMLDQLGLVAALRWYAETRLGENGTRVEVTEQGNAQRLPAAIETALFRAVQETINNVARHAGARRVQIAFNFQKEQVEVQVVDNGIGFDLHQVTRSTDPRRGLGLMSLQERMSAVGGEFFLTSAPGQGTTVLLRAPITGGGNGSDTRAGGG